MDITVGEYGLNVFVWGFYNGGGSHYIRVQAYNYTDSTYEDVGVIGLGSTVQLYEYNLTPDHTDTAEKLTGELSAWHRANFLFVDLLRQQFLMFRTLPDDLKAQYLTRARGVFTPAGESNDE